jgi:serine/threonine-protein kinase 24/25/MST4
MNGTIMREADLGTGIDTIRPIKRVDAAGSLRMSSEFVGSLRQREDGSSSPVNVSPTKDSSLRRRQASEVAKAGQSLVADIVVPTIQGASGFL